MGWLEFQRNVDAWRNLMLVPQMLAPIGRWFLDAARVSQGVSGSVRIKWTPPRREMISPRDEVPFIVDAIRAGLTSRDHELRKMGFDPELIDAEIKTGNDRADSMKIVLDSDPRHRTTYGSEVQDQTPEGGTRGREGPERRTVNRLGIVA
jgi:capsid protein